MSPGSGNRVTNEQYRVVWESREELRSKVAELEDGILGVLAHYKRFSTVTGGDVGKKAASTILLKMKSLGLCGLGEGGDAP